MAFLINVHHYFHNDPEQTNLLKEMNSKLDKLIESNNNSEELKQLAQQLKEGNQAVKDAIAKNSSGNIA